MNFDLQQASARLKELRTSLVQNYNDEDLHQLRVTLRRMRSILRGLPGGKARKLRRRLGALAHATNGARDWDTLYASASDCLQPEQFSALQPALDAQRECARARVYKMLHEKQWLTTLRRWDALIDTNELDPDSPSVAPRKLATRLKRTNAAARKAVARDDDEHWHKLRIAIKELRYALDTLADQPRESRNAALLAECKTLQTLLGNWHDTVVHRQLLDTLVTTGTPSGKAASELQQLLAQRGLDSLEQIKHRLRHGGLSPQEHA